MLATPAVVMPFTQTFAGMSSMNDPVQSPALEIVSRNPDSPGAGTLAKECHSLSGLRLIAVDEPAKGVSPWSKRARTTCEEGRSRRTSTLRSLSQGRATLKVTTDRTATSTGPGDARRVCVQNRARAVQPPKRWIFSKWSWWRERKGGRAVATISARRAVRVQPTAVSRWSSAVRVSATNHAVPASAPPMCSPPKWYTLPSVQRTFSGQLVGADVASRKRRLTTYC